MKLVVTRGLIVSTGLWALFYAASGCTWEQSFYLGEPAIGLSVPAAAAAEAEAAPEEGPWARAARVPFGPGEHLEFSVNYNVLRAGTATLSVESIESYDGHDCYKLVSTARSNSVVSTFFEVRDRVESLMDVQGLFTRRFEKHLKEGGYVKDEVVHFDYSTQRAYYADGDTVEILPSTQDALSALYYARTLDLEVGKLVAFPDHSGKKNYPLRVRVLGKEKIRTPAGKFNCVVVEPRMKGEGIFKHKGRLTVWLTDDDRRMPVKMKSQIVIGAITAELVRWSAGRPVAVSRAAEGAKSVGDR
jgi:hypothetical protein